MSLNKYIRSEGGARKYTGETATGYNAKRQQSEKWQIEQQIIENMLADLPEGTKILDVPCGTGRFFRLYNEKKFNVWGIDLSADMIAEATREVSEESRLRYRFSEGNILSLPCEDKSADVGLMIRITRWLRPDECVQALSEMQRVCRDKIILTARVRNHPEARPYSLINNALAGWHIAEDVAGYTEDYRILALEPTT